MITYHQNADGTEVKFEVRQEQTARNESLIYCPLFLNFRLQHQKVYVIDEVDRSLHTLLTRQLLSSYLASCSPETRTQLLLTA